LTTTSGKKRETITNEVGTNSAATVLNEFI